MIKIKRQLPDNLCRLILLTIASVFYSHNGQSQSQRYFGIHSGVLQFRYSPVEQAPFIGVFSNPSKSENWQLHLEANIATPELEGLKYSFIQFKPLVKWCFIHYRLQPYVMAGPGWSVLVSKSSDSYYETLNLNWSLGLLYELNKDLSIGLRYEHQYTTWTIWNTEKTGNFWPNSVGLLGMELVYELDTWAE